MRQKIWLTWDDNQTPPWAYPIVWSSNPYTWEEVAVFIEIAEPIISGGGGLGQVIFQQGTTGLTGSHIDDLKKKYTEEKVDTFIKVVCKINSVDYEKRKDRKTKPIVTVKEIEHAYEKLTGIKVNVKIKEK